MCYKPYAAAYPAPGPTGCPALVSHIFGLFMLAPFTPLDILRSWKVLLLLRDMETRNLDSVIEQNIFLTWEVFQLWTWRILHLWSFPLYSRKGDSYCQDFCMPSVPKASLLRLIVPPLHHLWWLFYPTLLHIKDLLVHSLARFILPSCLVSVFTRGRLLNTG